MGISNDKMEVSVLCVPGINEKLVDNFYINGRTREWLDSSIINIVMEKTLADGIFAVTSNMDSDPAKGSSISLMKDIRRFQTQYEKNGGDIDSKTALLREQIATTNNYLYSLNLARTTEGEDERMPEGSVALTFIEDDHYTLLTTGTAKAFIYSNGITKQLTNSKLKIEKLIKLGVMTEDQARGLNARDDEDGITQHAVATLSSGDCLVLCAGKSNDFITEENLSYLLSSQNNNSSRMSDLLRSAVSEGVEEDLTLMIVKVGDSEFYEDAYLDDFEDDDYGKIPKYLATIFACLLCFIIGLAGGYKVLPFILGKSVIQASSNVKNTTSPEIIPTEAPNEETEKPTKKPTTATTSPTEEPQTTIKPTVKPTQSPTDAPTVNEEGNRVYTVQSGDSLASIAVKFYDKYSYYKKIADANNIKSPYVVNVGQKLIIPEDI